MPAKKILRHSRYNPGRGGHAPGDLRDAWLEAVENLIKSRWQLNGEMPCVQVRDHEVPIDEIFRLLWNCSDILPGWVHSELNGMVDNPPRVGGSYAAASRFLLREIVSKEA